MGAGRERESQRENYLAKLYWQEPHEPTHFPMLKRTNLASDISIDVARCSRKCKMIVEMKSSIFTLTYVSLLKRKLFQTNPNVGIPLNSHCLRERPGSYIVGRMDICAIDNAFLGKPGL